MFFLVFWQERYWQDVQSLKDGKKRAPRPQGHIRSVVGVTWMECTPQEIYYRSWQLAVGSGSGREGGAFSFPMIGLRKGGNETQSFHSMDLFLLFLLF